MSYDRPKPDTSTDKTTQLALTTDDDSTHDTESDSEEVLSEATMEWLKFINLIRIENIITLLKGESHCRHDATDLTASTLTYDNNQSLKCSHLESASYMIGGGSGYTTPPSRKRLNIKKVSVTVKSCPGSQASASSDESSDESQEQYSDNHLSQTHSQTLSSEGMENCQTPESNNDESEYSDQETPKPFKGVNECSICYSPLVASKVSCKTQCNHIFHFSCLLTWIETKRGNAQCAYCRSPQLPLELSEPLSPVDFEDQLAVLYCKIGDHQQLGIWINENPNEIQPLLQNYRHSDGRTLVHIACSHSTTSTLHVLNQYITNTDANAVDEHFNTPLHTAVIANAGANIEVLVNAGANINAQNSKKQTPLHLAIQSDNFEIFQILLSLGAKVNATDEDGELPLHLAVRSGSYSMVDELIEKDKNLVSIANDAGLTPLHYAISADAHIITRRLTEETSDINHEWNVPYLHHAIESRNEEAVHTLLSFKAYVSITNAQGVTSLEFAEHSGMTNILDVLKKAQTSQWPESPVSLAIRYKQWRVAEALLDRNIDTSSPDNLLFLAIAPNGLGVVNRLIKKGWNVNSCDRNGHRPLDIAKIKHLHDIQKAIIEADGMTASEASSSSPSCSIL